MEPKPLKPKIQAFVDHYLANGRNAVKAAVSAGYVEGYATQLMAREDVKAAIAARIEAVTAKFNITQEWIAEEILALHNKCKEPVPVFNRKGEQVFHTVTGPDGKEMQVPAYMVFDPKTSAKCMELLGKYRKMFTEKLEHTTPHDDKPPVMPKTAEEAARWYQAKMRESPPR